MSSSSVVRLKLNITVIVFCDGGYNIVAFQQEPLRQWNSGSSETASEARQ